MGHGTKDSDSELGTGDGDLGLRIWDLGLHTCNYIPGPGHWDSVPGTQHSGLRTQDLQLES